MHASGRNCPLETLCETSHSHCTVAWCLQHWTEHSSTSEFSHSNPHFFFSALLLYNAHNIRPYSEPARLRRKSHTRPARPRDHLHRQPMPRAPPTPIPRVRVVTASTVAFQICQVVPANALAASSSSARQAAPSLSSGIPTSILKPKKKEQTPRYDCSAGQRSAFHFNNNNDDDDTYRDQQDSEPSHPSIVLSSVLGTDWPCVPSRTHAQSRSITHIAKKARGYYIPTQRSTHTYTHSLYISTTTRYSTW